MYRPKGADFLNVGIPLKYQLTQALYHMVFASLPNQTSSLEPIPHGHNLICSKPQFVHGSLAVARH